MNFFDDDSFDDIVREFFGPGRSSPTRRHSNTIIRGEEEDRNIDFIENEDYLYLIFELPGYNENDVNVNVKDRTLEVKASKKNCDIEKVRDYLTQKLCRGIFIKKNLPAFIDTKGYRPSMKNGILEIKFVKK